MEPKTLKMMFQEFRQAESSIARSRGGLGLGMALSRRLVKLHGGKLTAASDGLGHGSCFTLELPLCMDQMPAPESTKALEPVKLKSHRILIVDDQRALRLPMKHLLKFLGQVARKHPTDRPLWRPPGNFDPRSSYAILAYPTSTVTQWPARSALTLNFPACS